MAYFTLDSITGLTSPISGLTTAYEQVYNDAQILTYYKRDINATGIKAAAYTVVVLFGNRTEIFEFAVIGDRDTFYTSLPS